MLFMPDVLGYACGRENRLKYPLLSGTIRRAARTSPDVRVGSDQDGPIEFRGWTDPTLVPPEQAL